MTIITTPPLILDSAGKPANGFLTGNQTARFNTELGLVTEAAFRAQIAKGLIVTLDGLPLDVPPTPEGQALVLYEVLIEPDVKGNVKAVPRPARNVLVPDAASVAYADLVDVSPPPSSGDWAVPPFVQELIDSVSTVSTVRDEAVAAKDAAEAAAASVPSEAELKATIALSGSYVSIDAQKLDSDPDDTLSVRRAIAAASTFGMRRVQFGRADYTVSSMIDLAGMHGVTIAGAGLNATRIRSSNNLAVVFGTTGDCSDIYFSDLAFEGSVVDDVEGPRRGRTTSGPGIQAAILLRGDLSGSTSFIIRNIFVDRCRFQNIASLPVFLQGVRGIAKIHNSHMENCLDTGFTFCESAIFEVNTVRKSADNGVSMSRGNKRVTVIGNNVDGSAFHGIWVAGFNSDGGPEGLTVVGNTVEMSGKNGIHLGGAPKYGVVSGNTIRDCLRGPSDQLNDFVGVGIWIEGLQDTSSGTFTGTFLDLAHVLLVTSNEIVRPRRGGIYLSGARYVDIRTNLIVDPGTATLNDGTTIVSTNAQHNFGIWQSDYPATVSWVTARENTLLDTRATPVANYPLSLSSTANSEHSENRVFGFRNGYTDSSQTFNGTQFFNAVTRAVGGVFAGSSGQSTNHLGQAGRANGYWLNGAAGARKPIMWQTASSDRFELAVNGDPESSGNAGSNLELLTKSDAGATLATVLTVMRATGQLKFGEGIDLAFGTATGTKFGTSGTQKISFYGVTPVVRPSLTYSRTGETAANAALRAALASLGLVADNTVA